MPMYCNIFTCENFTGCRKGANCSFFKTPADTDKRNKWLDEIKKYQKIDMNFVICQLHFEPKYLHFYKTGVRLSRDAIPTIFKAKQPPVSIIQKTSTTESVSLTTNKQTINNKKLNVQQQNVAFESQTQSTTKTCEKCIQQDVTIQMLKVKITRLQATCDERQEHIDDLRRELRIATRPLPIVRQKCAVCNSKFPVDYINQHVCCGENEIRCDYCEQSFTSTFKLIEHLKHQHHEKTFYHCEFCSKKFSMPLLLQYHKKCHPLDQNDHLCSVCNEKYVTKYQLNKHIDEVHLGKPPKEENIPFECGTCGECFTMARQLIGHMTAAHQRTIDCECFICHMKFESLKATRNHIQQCHMRSVKCLVCDQKCTMPELELHTCTGLEQSLNCSYCQQAFSTTTRLLKHLNDCKSEKLIYKCDFKHCGKYFSMESLTTLHMKCHENKSKEFICDICAKSFAKDCLLFRHKQRHNASNRQYLCDECGKGPFENVTYLKRHKRLHDEKIIECPKCDKKFSHKFALTKHLRDRHQNFHVVCNICGAKVRSFNALTEHKKIHTRTDADRKFACKLCPLKFFEANRLQRHMQQKHFANERYECEYCQQNYKYKGDLNKHLRTHLGDDMYACPTCPKRFRYIYDLENHKFEHYEAAKSDQIETN